LLAFVLVKFCLASGQQLLGFAVLSVQIWGCNTNGLNQKAVTYDGGFFTACTTLREAAVAYI
jgi:hypothetical protein